MIKLAVKLAIVALVANATWRIGSAYLDYYRFTDAVQNATQFRGDKSDEEIRARLFELASQYDVAIGEDQLTVARQGEHTVVDGEYTRPIDVVPGFTYDWTFTLHVDTVSLKPASPEPSAVP